MKTLLLITLLSLSSFMVHGDSTDRPNNDFLKFVAQNQGLRQLALFVVMEERCYKYFPEAKAKVCALSSKKTLSLLDFDLILNDADTRSFVFVAFQKEFLRLLGEKSTETYLNLINEKLNRFLTGEDRVPANLWETSVKYFGSKRLAALALAALFQDTSMRKLHLAWIDRKGIQGTPLFQQNKELLDRVIETVNFIMDSTDVEYRTLFYPEGVSKIVNRNVYHFYVPLYLALGIEESGMKKEDAVLGPLMMTLSYEFITAAPDLRYLFADPAKVAEASLLDIFAGYAGGRTGVTIPLMKFDQVKEAFAQSTKSGVTSLLSF